MRNLFALPVAAIAGAGVLWGGCLGALPDPTRVEDLRVLGVQTEPPELMLTPPPGNTQPLCQGVTAQEAIRVATASVQYTALIVDPQGNGRSVHYQLFGCARQDDRNCATTDQRVLLREGDVQADPVRGDVLLPLTLDRLALTVLGDDTPLLQKVQEEDQYQGAFGIRMPLVLHLTAGSEEIWAQKLMVYSCAYFPGKSFANVNPVLPGVTLKGAPWGEAEVPVVQGDGNTVRLAVPDFSEREEDYAVPSYSLEPVSLHESWRISWYSTLGTLGPATTGGTDVSGSEGRNFSDWNPSSKATQEQEVRFWMVARDGRGGLSWLRRTLHYLPKP